MGGRRNTRDPRRARSAPPKNRTCAFRARTSTASTLLRGGTGSTVSIAPRSCRGTQSARARRAWPRAKRGEEGLQGGNEHEGRGGKWVGAQTEQVVSWGK